MEKKIDIGGELHSVATDHKVADASEIKDISKGNKSQTAFNNDIDRHEVEIHGTGGIESRLTDVEQIEQIVLDGGEVQIAQGGDFTNPDATKRAKIPTVGAIVDGLNDGIYDVSKRNPTGGPNSDGKFTLDYILDNAATLIPTSWRHGGMTISFVQSSDNKYLQYRLMSDTFSTTESDWQGVDSEPVAGSKNLVESGGVFDDLYPKLQITLTHGYRIKSDGTYASISNSSEASEDYIPTENAKTLIGKFWLDNNGYIAFYNEDKVLISTYHTTEVIEHVVSIPNNTAFIRVSNRYDQVPSPEFRLANKQVGRVVGTYTSGCFTQVDANGNVINSKHTISDFNLYEDVPIKGNINLLCPNGIADLYIINTGEIRSYEGFFLLDYIKVKPSTNYYMSTGNNAIIGSGASGICFYDKNLQFISGIPIDKQFSTPANCEYIRCSSTVAYVSDLANSKLQLSEGTTLLPYVPYNPIEKYIEDYNNRQNYNGKITNLANFVGTKIDNAYGTNLFDKNSQNIVKGKYLNYTNGNFIDYDIYGISDYIPVIAGEKYTLTRDLSSGPTPNPTTISGGGTGLCFYDAQKNFISGVHLTERTFTMPDGTYYIRTTFQLADINNSCVNKGEERLFYEVGSPIKGYDKYIQNIIYESSPAASKCGRNSHVIGVSTLSNDIFEDVDFPGYVKSSSVVSAYGKITQFSEALVGVGGNVTHPLERYIKVDTTNVYFCRKVEGGNEQILATYTHGLTISTFVGIVFITKDTKSKVILSTLGGYYEKEEDYSIYASTYGSNVIECYGHPFIKVDSNTQLTEVTLESNCPRFKNSIWVVGDSYVSLSSFRWPWQLRQIKDIEFNIIGLAGSISVIMLNDFYISLNYGTPKYLVWALGMNDDSDADENTPNARWLSCVDYVIKYCERYGITPILTTIPNVPSRSHIGKNKWVRESGYRYIDFCKAVGATDAGVWYNGCLSEDEVHPTEIGAKALASGVLKDFSEITM